VDSALAEVFKATLSPIFVGAYRTAQRSQEAFTQLCGLLDLWSSRQIYHLGTTASVRAHMLDAVRISALVTPGRRVNYVMCATLAFSSVLAPVSLIFLSYRLHSQLFLFLNTHITA
jgi:hypothetical protein